MAEGDRGGGWQPPNDDEPDQRDRSGGLSSGDPLWSGSRRREEDEPPRTEPTARWPRPADEDERSAAWPRPAQGGGALGGWEPPAGSGGSQGGWEAPGGSGTQHRGWEPPGGPSEDRPRSPWGPPAGQAPTQWGPPPGQWGPQAGGAYYGPQRSNGKATASLICGIVGLIFCPLIFSIAALVLG